MSTIAAGRNAMLGHVHLKVNDLEPSRSFYMSLLALKETEGIPGAFSFLSFGDAHHDLALQQSRGQASPSLPRTPGLYHLAFEVASAEILRSALAALKALKHHVQLVDHGISWALYTSDPDGNGLELFLDRRASPSGKKEWNGTSRGLSEEQLTRAV